MANVLVVDGNDVYEIDVDSFTPKAVFKKYYESEDISEYTSEVVKTPHYKAITWSDDCEGESVTFVLRTVV